MSKFRYHPTLLDRAQRMMKSGLWAEPAWYEGLRRSPPMTYTIPNKKDIPVIKFDEDDLYDAVLQKQPLLKLQQVNPHQRDGNLAWQFARHQCNLMKTEKMEKKQAYQKNRVIFQRSTRGVLQLAGRFKNQLSAEYGKKGTKNKATTGDNVRNP